MTGRAIGLKTKNTVPAINLNPATKLRTFSYNLYYVKWRTATGFERKAHASS